MTHQEIEALVNELGLYNAIEEVRNRMVTPYPSFPKKPFMKNNPNSNEAKIYYHELQEWEEKMEGYDKDKQLYETTKQVFNKTIESFIKQHAGLYTIPEKSQQKVWDKAWEDGHSEGYYRVYQELVELIDLFK